MDTREIAADLRHAGYSDREGGSPLGSYRLLKDGIEITPGPESYHSPDPARIVVRGAKVQEITSRGNELSAYELEPQLITALFQGGDRSKRQIVKFNEIPKVLVDAVLAIEDRRFFQHSGVNYYRLAEAGIADVVHHRAGAGRVDADHAALAGVLPDPGEDCEAQADGDDDRHRTRAALQQAADFRALRERSRPWDSAAHLASADLARRPAPTSIKTLKTLTLPEAALLAGLIQRPSYLSPYRHPERALDRRNLVLDSMVETGAITRDQADKAKATPLKLAPPNVEASDAPYFVDMVKDFLTAKYSENEINDNHIAFTPRLIRTCRRRRPMRWNSASRASTNRS